jgi:RND family efflux transporter MFP subunit
MENKMSLSFNHRRLGISRRPLSLLGALGLILASGAAFAADYPFALSGAEYEVAPRERIWDGTVEAVNEATVSAQTAGRVTSILVDVNDFVEAGEVLIRLTDTEQRSALKSAQANLLGAEARAAEAAADFARIEDMFKNETVSRARMDQAKANNESAKASAASARAGVTAAREQLDYTVIRAPYAGIVSRRLVEAGESVGPGQPLMTGLSLQQLRVNVDVPQGMIDSVRQIGKAVVHYGDIDIAAESITFFPVADAASNTFRVRVNLPQTDVVLYPGMFVKVGFVVGETQRLLIPVSALVRRSELTAVYVADGRGGMGLRQVRLGHTYGDRLEILAGLDEGEQVALDPVQAGIYLKHSRGQGADHEQ